eukprot:jgi/Chrzof1/9855/Cz04g18140.t1
MHTANGTGPSSTCCHFGKRRWRCSLWLQAGRTAEAYRWFTGRVRVTQYACQLSLLLGPLCLDQAHLMPLQHMGSQLFSRSWVACAKMASQLM